MQTLIYKKPILFLPNLKTSNFFLLQSQNNRDFLGIQPRNGFKTLSLCSATSPPPLSYGGWDDFQLNGDSVESGEANLFHNLLSSFGIGDKKYVFVYLFGFVCALAISRVKVSSIMVYPACAIVSAVGFSVGFVKGGHLREFRLHGNRKKLTDETLRGCIEKLKGYTASVLDLKNGLKRSIECNQVTVNDLQGYIDVIESVDTSLRNTLDVIESCMHNILGGNQDKEGGCESSDHEFSRRRKKSGENGLKFSQYVGGLFGGKFNGSKSSKIEGSGRTEVKDADVNNKRIPNILASSVKERNSSRDESMENMNASIFGNHFDNTGIAQNRAENFVVEAGLGSIDVDSERNYVGENEMNYSAEAVLDQTIYNYQNKTSRFVNNQQIHFKEYQDEIEAISTHHNNMYDSMDVSISMNHIKTVASSHHQQKRETTGRNYLHLQNSDEELKESHRYPFEEGIFNSQRRPANKEYEHEGMFDPSPSVLGDDLRFNRYLEEANGLLKEAKRGLKRQVDGRVEHTLRKSAILLSKAIDMRPMSLLAVGQLGNTYLLHGELKLRMSRDLRSQLVRTDPFLVEWVNMDDRLDDQLSCKDKIASALVNACEECEELLIKAGRKYRMALSIDGNDMRALYNWGLALSFRAQLIADVGPSAARDADKIYLAAIEKFDAMMSKSNVYASDALFRWGAALQHRSWLRPSRSRERAKLLQQARRLYEDALNMDSGNPQLQEALSSCISELDYW